MVTYSVQKEVFVNYILQSVNVEHRDTDLMGAIKFLDSVNEMSRTLPDVYKYKEKKVSEHGTKVIFYFDTPIIIRYKLVRHEL